DGEGPFQLRRIEQIDLRAFARREFRSQQRALGVEYGGRARYGRTVRVRESRRVAGLHSDAPLHLVIAKLALRLQHDDRGDFRVGYAGAVAGKLLELGQALPLNLRNTEPMGRLRVEKTQPGNVGTRRADAV